MSLDWLWWGLATWLGLDLLLAIFWARHRTQEKRAAADHPRPLAHIPRQTRKENHR